MWHTILSNILFLMQNNWIIIPFIFKCLIYIYIKEKKRKESIYKYKSIKNTQYKYI